MKIFFKVVFSRIAVIFLLLLLQLGVLFSWFYWLGSYSMLISIMLDISAAILIVYILNRDENPAIKMTWMIIIFTVPVFGALLYMFVSTNFGYQVHKKRVREVLEHTKPFLEQEKKVLRHLKVENPQIANLASYMTEYGGYPICENTTASYFPLGENMYEEMKKQLETAKEFIFMEYFIVHEGKMWDSILEILKRKVKEGVEVRFMYDGMCSIVLVPYNYPEKLERFGIKCKQFFPIRPALTTHQNNRDHRKICVIDGKTAFTGGVNLADEYINEREVYGHWKDTSVMIQGDAVNSFTIMFLENWNLSEKKEDDYGAYIRTNPIRMFKAECGYVMPYGDSPMDNENVGEQVYMSILNRATKYVHIITPYLVIDNEMLTALTYAAKRGVEVIMILPYIPDKKYMYLLARTYYQDLIAGGVKIYEYTPGFVHAKSFVSDDMEAVVGSINLDFRSLYLHFECAAYFYKNPVVQDVERDFRETLKKCKQITKEDCENYPKKQLIAGHFLKLFAPLM